MVLRDGVEGKKGEKGRGGSRKFECSVLHAEVGAETHVCVVLPTVSRACKRSFNSLKLKTVGGNALTAPKNSWLTCNQGH